MKKIKEMKMHDSIEDRGLIITRVPGGLLYQRYTGTNSPMVFILFTNFNTLDTDE